MSTQITDANALVNYIKSFTGSKDDDEIKQCIFLAEFTMRNLELPALRTNPWTTTATADSNGYISIPSDMLKPIVFFNSGGQTNGPWIIYDRIGERDMIAQQLVAKMYLNPVNIPVVYRGQFAEVGQQYEFTPVLSAGDVINLYYYTTWPELFSLDSLGNPILTNAILQSWPEGYIYGTLREYYLKRKMPDDAAVWDAKFQYAWDQVEDQNNKGKWSGGHTKLWSVWQPRQYRRFSTK